MSDATEFDTGAAITRSLLGWGVVAGVWYLAAGVLQGLLRDGFDFSRHALSLLMLGELGWIQRVVIALAGLMVLAAAAGFARATSVPRIGVLLGAFGACLIASGIFPPDPMAGFPPGSAEGDGSASGIAHLAFGGIGFVSLAVAALVVGGWFGRRGDRRSMLLGRLAAAVVVLGFVGGGALATSVAGVVALWIAVVTAFAWLAAASVATYRTVPHPDGAHRCR